MAAACDQGSQIATSNVLRILRILLGLRGFPGRQGVPPPLLRWTLRILFSELIRICEAPPAIMVLELD